MTSPIDLPGLSNGGRSGLTGFVAGLARTTVRDNVTVTDLLPGTFEAARTTKVFGARAERSSLALAEGPPTARGRSGAGRRAALQR